MGCYANQEIQRLPWETQDLALKDFSATSISGARASWIQAEVAAAGVANQFRSAIASYCTTDPPPS
jgi:hypothetical protein